MGRDAGSCCGERWAACPAQSRSHKSSALAPGRCLWLVDVPTRVQPGWTCRLRDAPLHLPAPPLGRPGPSAASVCAPVKWETHAALLTWGEPGAQQGRLILVSSFPSSVTYSTVHTALKPWLPQALDFSGPAPLPSWTRGSGQGPHSLPGTGPAPLCPTPPPAHLPPGQGLTSASLFHGAQALAFPTGSHSPTENGQLLPSTGLIPVYVLPGL